MDLFIGSSHGFSYLPVHAWTGRGVVLSTMVKNDVSTGKISVQLTGGRSHFLCELPDAGSLKSLTQHFSGISKLLSRELETPGAGDPGFRGTISGRI